MNIDWNAKDYTGSFSFVPRYGEEVLELLDIRPGDKVIDLGCGNGALTQKLADRGADVTGIDASAEMLSEARELYPDLTFKQGDALALTVDTPVDAIFSNAVFHWIDKKNQPVLLSRIYQALKPGGQLVCEFGGKHCAGRVHKVLRQLFAQNGFSYPLSFYFPSVGEYTPLMEACGLKVVYATLFDRPTRCEGGNDGLRNWIEMFDKEPFQALTGTNVKDKIIHEAEEMLRDELFHDGSWYVDYVRIRIKAIKR